MPKRSGIREGYNPPPRNAKRPGPPPAPPAPLGQCPAPDDHAIADRARAELARLEADVAEASMDTKGQILWRQVQGEKRITPPLVIEDQNMTVTFEIAKDGEA